MKTFGLYGFSTSGRSNLIAVVRAKSDKVAAKKLGGAIIGPTMSRDQMSIYGMRLSRVVGGEGWSQFEFGNRNISATKALKRLADMTDQSEWATVTTATNSDHLVLAQVPFLER